MKDKNTKHKKQRRCIGLKRHTHAQRSKLLKDFVVPMLRKELGSNLIAIAADGSLVAGMHLPLPGIGHIRAEGEGSYAWVPIEFEPLPEFSTTPTKDSSY